MARLLAASAALFFGLFSSFATPAQAVAPAQPYFTPIPDETIDGRQGAIAAELPDGRVLIAGGADNLALRSAELFDPTTNTFSPVPGLTRVKRVRAMAAELPDGRVLIAGGANEVLYTSAEIFDPATGTFADVSDEMTSGRIKGIAAPLPDGEVLIAGGQAEGKALNTAELFDPATETFTALGSRMWNERSAAVAAPLPDGRVLIAGGLDEANPAREAEVFDPTTNTFSIVDPKMADDSRGAVAAPLASGGILIAGGWDSGALPIRDAGLLDPDTLTFTALPRNGNTELTTERADATAAPLPNGRVLISGGSWPDARSSAELFVPSPAARASGGGFGRQVIGETSPPSTVTVTNLGAQALRVDSVSLAGGDADAFTVLSDACTGQALAFEDACVLSVRFAPSRPGPAQATLYLEDNEPTPASVRLTGAGMVRAIEPGELPAATTDRHATSVKCRVKATRKAKKATVTCRVDPGDGLWEAQLKHAGHSVAYRRLTGGPQVLSFKLTRRGRGGYRLEMNPLP